MLKLWSMLACAAPSPIGPILADNAVDLEHGQLAIADRGVTAALLRALLDANEVPSLVRIRAGGNALDASAAALLASHPKTSALVALDLNANAGFGAVGVRALAGAPMLGTLEELRIAGTGADGAALATLGPAPALLLLEASYNPVDDAAVAWLSGLGALQRLYLRDTYVSGAAVRRLMEHPALLLLDAEGTRLGPGALAGPVAAPSLKGLDLARTGIGAEDAVALAGAALTLESLDLSGDPIGDVGMDAIAGAPWLGALQALELRDVTASPEAQARLRAAWGARAGLTL